MSVSACRPPHAGMPAPDLELPSATGEIHSLRSRLGMPVLVTFMSHAA